MKNTLRILTLVLCLILTASVMVACSNDEKKDDTNPAPAPIETTAPAVELISEEEAKEMVWTDLNIPETAANDLKVELKDNNYIISFNWSGFDYQYTIDGVNKDILEIIFDGEPLR